MIAYNPIHYFELGPIKIYSFGLMFAIGVAVAAFLSYKTAKKYDLDGKKILDALVYILVGALVGARLVYFLLYYYQFSSPVEFFYIWEGGLASHGGFIGGFLSFYLFSKKHKINFWKYADLLAPYIALALAIVRIGCFINWDDYGKYTSLPWGISAEGDFPRHPAQIYHIISDFMVFLILYKIKDKKRFDGQIFLLLVILYSIGRFIVDFFRDYDYYVWGIAPSQIFVTALFITSIILYRKMKT